MPNSIIEPTTQLGRQFLNALVNERTAIPEALLGGSRNINHEYGVCRADTGLSFAMMHGTILARHPSFYAFVLDSVCFATSRFGPRRREEPAVRNRLSGAGVKSPTVHKAGWKLTPRRRNRRQGCRQKRRKAGTLKAENAGDRGGSKERGNRQTPGETEDRARKACGVLEF